MKKIDINKSLIFSRNIEDLQNSLEYLNLSGYFSNSDDFSVYEEGELDGVHAANFIFRPYEVTHNGDNQFFIYFIPKLKAVFIEEEPKEKKLRKFKSIDEFYAITGLKIGEVVRMKRFGNYTYYETSILNGVRVYTDPEFNNKMEVIFGSLSRSFKELFENFKYYKNGKWLRFGVEE